MDFMLFPLGIIIDSAAANTPWSRPLESRKVEALQETSITRPSLARALSS